jgi:hypothetical protein
MNSLRDGSTYPIPRFELKQWGRACTWPSLVFLTSTAGMVVSIILYLLHVQGEYIPFREYDRFGKWLSLSFAVLLSVTVITR